MALTPAPGIYPRLTTFSGNPATLAIDADGEKLAYIFRVPKTGNIRTLWFRIATTNTADTLRVSLQDVTPTTGSGDETIDQSGTVILDNGDDNVWKSVTLDADRAVTRQEPLAMMIEFDAFAGGSVAISAGTADDAPNHCYSALKTGGTWSKSALRCPVMVVVYDDGSIAPIYGAFPAQGTFHDVNTGTDPKERGMRFRIPWEVQLGGGVYYGSQPGDVLMALYDDSGSTTPIAVTRTNDGNVVEGAGATPVSCFFTSPPTLAANTYYRFTVRPTSTTSVRTYRYTASQLEHLDGFYGGRDFHYAELSAASAWTTNTAVRFAGSLLIRQVHA